MIFISVIRIPDIINYNYPILGLINASLYLLTWIFFVLATINYFSKYIKAFWSIDV